MIDKETYRPYNIQDKINQNRPHPSNIKFNFSIDNEYDSLHKNENLNSKYENVTMVPKTTNSKNALRGTTKKIIQVSNSEEEITMRQNQLLIPSQKQPAEEKPSILAESKIKPNEFRNKLKQEIEKLHHQQEVEKLNQKEEEKIESKNTPVEESIKQDTPENEALIETDSFKKEKSSGDIEKLEKLKEEPRKKMNTNISNEIPSKVKSQIVSIYLAKKENKSESEKINKFKDIVQEKVVEPKRSKSVKIDKNLNRPFQPILEMPEKAIDTKKEINHFSTPNNENKSNDKLIIKKVVLFIFF